MQGETSGGGDTRESVFFFWIGYRTARIGKGTFVLSIFDDLACGWSFFFLLGLDGWMLGRLFLFLFFRLYSYRKDLHVEHVGKEDQIRLIRFRLQNKKLPNLDLSLDLRLDLSIFLRSIREKVEEILRGIVTGPLQITIICVM
jgi:hypothetical protein